MTAAVCPASPTTAGGGVLHSLRWQELDHVFELQSESETVVNIASGVFSPNNPPESRRADCVWQVEEQHAGEARRSWKVSASSRDTSMIPLVVANADTAVLHVEYDALAYLSARTKYPGFHAALLSRGNDGVIIVGPSLAGKSTLATALWQRGWTLLSDDMTFIHPGGRAASAAPRRVSIRFGSRALIGESLWGLIAATPSCVTTQKGLFFHPHEVNGSPRVRETRVAAIFFLARLNVSLRPAETRAINPAKAAVALIPYAPNVRRLPFPEAVREVSVLTTTVPAFDLGRGRLPDMVAAVELQVERNPIAAQAASL